MESRDEIEKGQTETGETVTENIRANKVRQMYRYTTPKSNIILTNCCNVNRTVYFGQLPQLALPVDIVDTGGMVYNGKTAYSNEIAPMWIVTSYRLARN